MPLESWSVVVSQKVYARLLRVYPRSHRREYGVPMAQLFRDQTRDAWAEARDWGVFTLWLRVVPDLVRSSIWEHVAALKGKKTMSEKISGVTGPGPAPMRTFFGVAVVMFLLVFGTTAAITFLLPEAFASIARVKVVPRARSLASQDGPTGESATPAHNPYFLQTEIEVIQSELVLGKVIESLNLNSEWGGRYAGGNKLKTSQSLGMLKNRLELCPVRNTSLVEVRAYSGSPNEAAKIANAVVHAYREYRLEQQRQLQMQGFETLTTQVQTHEAKVRDAQAELDRLRQELQISDADAAGSAPTPMDADTVKYVAATRNESEVQLAGLQKQLDQLNGMTKPQLREVLPTLSQDPSLQDLLSQLDRAEVALAKVRIDVGPQHPNVIVAEGQIKLLKQRIDDRTVGIMMAMSNQLATTKVKIDRLSEIVAESQAKGLARVKERQPYYDKKRQVEELIRFSSVLKMKLATEQVDAQWPKLALPEIVDRAVPGLRAVRPNKPLNLVLGAAGGCLVALLVGCGAALVVTLRRRNSFVGPAVS